MGSKVTTDKEADNNKKKKFKLNTLQKVVLITIASIAVIFAGFYGLLYASSPEHIRRPAFEHAHIRTQIIVNGKPVDFSKQKFQEPINNTSCSVEITETPVHFHDKQDQMTHIHWKSITGGEFLKYYGWNFIGGSEEFLGTRFDEGLFNQQSVKIKGKLLPELPDNVNYYIYTGGVNSYEQKNWDNFLNTDLESFFGKESTIGSTSSSLNRFVDMLTPTVAAHGDVDDNHSEISPASDKNPVELERINNLLGNVVIFVQEKKPIDDEVQSRFNKLVPLTDSICGG